MMQKKQKDRNSSFELLRIILMVLIVFHHAITHGLGLDSFAAWSRTDLIIDAGEMNLYLCLNNLTIFAVNTFVIISGLFGIKTTWKKALSILSSVLFFTFFFTTLPYLILGEFKETIKSLLILSHSPYWFIIDYWILMLFAPLLNEAFDTVDEKYMKSFSIIIIVISTYLGFIWGDSIDKSGYNFFHFIVLYTIGRVLSKGWLQLSKYNAIIVFVLSVAINSMVACWLYNNGKYDTLWQSTYYSNPFVLLSAASLVMFMKGITFTSRSVNWIASSCLSIYLFQNAEWPSKLFYQETANCYMVKMGGGGVAINHRIVLY